VGVLFSWLLLSAMTAQAAPLSLAELESSQASLRTAPAPLRLSVAQRVAAADPESLPILEEFVGRPLTSAVPTLRRLIHAIWGQYPNPEYPKGPGKDPPMWLVRPEPPIPPGTPRGKRPKPHDPEAADWLVALAQLELSGPAADPFLADQPSAELHAARAELLLRVAVLRALGRLAAAEHGDACRDAVLALFQQAFVAEGLLRDECGRMLRSIGGAAVPTLVRIYNDRARYGFRMRRYAAYQLDRMDRMLPRKAIAAAADDRIRAEILHTYGEVLPIDAIEAVLDQVGAQSHRVRREARWAWLRYVDGPPPPPAPKRKRKLPGGKEESEEKEDYLNYRDMAVLTLGKAYQALFERAPDPKLSPRAQSEQLFAHYDRKREANFAQGFASAKAAVERGDLARAVDEYSWILANEPDHERRGEMAAVFARHGEALIQQAEQGRGTDGLLLGRGVGLLRVALLLDPALPDAAKLRARIHTLDGLQARRAGADGTADFRQAIDSDPQHSEAKAGLRRASLQQPRWHLVAWALLGTGLALLLLLWLRGRRRPAPALSLLTLLLPALLATSGCLVPQSLSEESGTDGGTLLIVKGAQPPFGTIHPTQTLDGYNFQIDVISTSPSVAGRLYAQISGDCCDLNIDDANIARFLYSGTATPLGNDSLRYTIDFRQTFPPCTLGFAGKMGYLIPVLATGGFRDDPKPFSPEGIGEVDRSHYWTVICP
jgi:hypothetical protein